MPHKKLGNTTLYSCLNPKCKHEWTPRNPKYVRLANLTSGMMMNTGGRRNEVAVKVSKLLKKENANIFDSLDILQNLEDAFIKELEFNINSIEEKGK